MSTSFDIFLSSIGDSFSVAVAVSAVGLIVSTVVQTIVSERDRKSKEKRDSEFQQALEALKNSSKKNHTSADVGDNRFKSGKELDELIAEAVDKRVSIVTNELRVKADLVSGLVNSYHTQALSQAKVQFWFSVIAATVGFVYILASAISANSPSEAAFRVIPGVVIDAVAFLFFKQSEETRQRATSLYDRLREDSQAEKASELLASIEDIHIRGLVQAQIALHKSGLKPKDLDLQLPKV